MVSILFVCLCAGMVGENFLHFKMSYKCTFIVSVHSKAMQLNLRRTRVVLEMADNGTLVS